MASASVGTVSSQVSSVTVPRPGMSHQLSQDEPVYHQYDSRTLPSLPKGSYPTVLQRGMSIDDQGVDQIKGGNAGMIS